MAPIHSNNIMRGRHYGGLCRPLSMLIVALCGFVRGWSHRHVTHFSNSSFVARRLSLSARRSVAHLNHLLQCCHVVSVVKPFSIGDLHVGTGTRDCGFRSRQVLRVKWVVLAHSILLLPGSICKPGTHHSLVIGVGLRVVLAAARSCQRPLPAHFTRHTH